MTAEAKKSFVSSTALLGEMSPRLRLTTGIVTT